MGKYTRGYKLMYYALKPGDPRYIERLMSKVTKNPGGCWLFTGGFREKKGYGIFQYGNETRAHRASWMMHKGDIPAGMCVCHKCDTPACVNPEHLFLGTAKDNVRDMHRKGRFFLNPNFVNAPRKIGSKHGMAKLTEEQVIEILIRHKSGEIRSQRELADEFGVTQFPISQIIKGKRWTHIDRNSIPVRAKLKASGAIRLEQKE